MHPLKQCLMNVGIKVCQKRSVKSVNRRKTKTWWNERMNEIKKCLNKAKRTYKRRSTEGNFIALQAIETEFKKSEEEENDKWVKILCDKITYSSTLALNSGRYDGFLFYVII